MANLVYDPPERVRAWLERRQRYVGSSDAAAVCGLSKWKTPLHVWVEKVEPLAASPPSDPQLFGLLLEPAIAKAVERRLGVELTEPDPAVHPDYGWMAATGDRQGPDGTIYEMKNVNEHVARAEWGEDGTDDVPEYYLIQAQQQMACYGGDRVLICALIGGCELRVYPVHRSDEAIARIVEIEAEFWDLVRSRRQPPPDWSHRSTPALLNALYRPEPGEVTTLGDSAQILVGEYETMGQRIKELSGHRDEMKARIIAQMGTAELGELPDGRRVKRGVVKRDAYTVKACEYTDFRVLSAPKGKRS